MEGRGLLLPRRALAITCRRNEGHHTIQRFGSGSTCDAAWAWYWIHSCIPQRACPQRACPHRAPGWTWAPSSPIYHAASEQQGHAATRCTHYATHTMHHASHTQHAPCIAHKLVHATAHRHCVCVSCICLLHGVCCVVHAV